MEMGAGSASQVPGGVLPGKLLCLRQHAVSAERQHIPVSAHWHILASSSCHGHVMSAHQLSWFAYRCQHIGTYFRHQAVMVMSGQRISCHGSHTGVNASRVLASSSCHVHGPVMSCQRISACWCHLTYLCQRFGTCGCRHSSGSWHTGHSWHLTGISLQNSPL